jgi:xylulose-5-phosphate/fructose-6-phosphate phosphoketolase
MFVLLVPLYQIVLTRYVEMMLCNRVSRYHVATVAVRAAALHNAKVAIEAHEMASHIMHLAEKDKEYIYREGQGKSMLPKSMLWINCSLDPDGTFESPVFENMQS